VLRVFPSKQFYFSTDTLIVNLIENGDDLGMVSHILTYNQLPLLKKLHYLMFNSAFVVDWHWMFA
jgi:hypothetical protein